MSLVQLRRVDPARNMARFYNLTVYADLFGQWWLVSEHGRIGSPGRVMTYPFPGLDEAAAALTRLWRAKVRRGYAST